MDIEDFFPSITHLDIRSYINGNQELFVDWDDEDIDCFVKLVCRNGRLTIGAPTSPALSNAICYDLDQRIGSICQERGVVYTRYADDMFFSTRSRGILGDIEELVHQAIRDAELPRALRVNERKTLHTSKRRKRVVTGLVITSEGRISIGRNNKRYIRSLLHKYHTLDDEKKTRLAGKLAYVKAVEPEFINRLVLKYGVDLVKRAMRG